MGKARSGQHNNDYYKVEGGAFAHDTLAKDRHRLDEGKAAPQHDIADVPKPPVSASGAGAETLARAQQHRAEQAKKKDE